MRCFVLKNNLISEVVTLHYDVPINPKLLGKEQKGTSPGCPKNFSSSLNKICFISGEGLMRTTG